MKKISLLLFFFVITASISVKSQFTFKVISVYGEILATKANILLEPSIEIKSDEKFEFKKPNSRAAMVSPQFGCIVLKEQDAGNSFDKAAFAPAISSVSARFGAVLKLKDLSEYFNRKLVIIEKLELLIDTEVYPKTDNTNFFVRGISNRDTLIVPLSFENGILTIKVSDFESAGVPPLFAGDDINLNLYYSNSPNENNPPKLISKFNPCFLQGKKLSSELNIIVDVLGIESFSGILDESHYFITQFYGEVEPPYLESWLKRSFTN
jgi:hypothetical protein